MLLQTQRGGATTDPGAHELIPVRITDKEIVVSGLYGLPTITRGVIATFYVVNDGTKRHNFVLLGHKTPGLAPKHHAQFTITLTRRGKFRFWSGTDSSSSPRGTLHVV